MTKMVKKYFILILLFPFFSSTFGVEKALINNVSYLLDEKSQRAEVVQTEGGYSGVVSIPSSVIYNGVTYTVASIGDEAFSGCSSLNSVSIPPSVSEIGNDAFSGCEGLSEVHISDVAAWCAIQFGNYYSNPLVLSHKLHLNGKLIQQLVLPSHVTAIGSRAFSECSSLTSVTIPYGATAIGDYAFSGCSGLVTLSMPATLATIGNGAFSFCSALPTVQIPASIQSIGTSAFYGCSSISSVHISDLSAWCRIRFADSKSNPLINAGRLYLSGMEIHELVLPADITSIGDYAFSDCTSLTSLTLHEGLSSIGHGAFSGCVGLTSLTFPSSLTSIGEDAFVFCGGLTDITFPSSTVSVGKDAFSGCVELKAIHILDLTSWCQSNFANYNSNPLFYAKHLYYNGEEVTNLIVPEGTKSIGDYAFVEYTLLDSIVLPQSVTFIGDGAFSGCTTITPTILLPEGLVSIGEKAFWGCTGLGYVILPASLVSVGKEAFAGCLSLKTVCSLAEIVPDAYIDTFDDATVGSMSLHVPDGCVGFYLRSAPWNKFAQVLVYSPDALPNSPAFPSVVIRVCDNCLHVQGLPMGKEVRVYSQHGQLVKNATSMGGELQVSLSGINGTIWLIETNGEVRKIIE